jgi:hypothetical protein
MTVLHAQRRGLIPDSFPFEQSLKRIKG